MLENCYGHILGIIQILNVNITKKIIVKEYLVDWKKMAKQILNVLMSEKITGG